MVYAQKRVAMHLSNFYYNHRDRIHRGRKGHKNEFLAYITNSWPSWAALIQLLLNLNLLPCKFFQQRGQGGAVYVCNVYDYNSYTFLISMWNFSITNKDTQYPCTLTASSDGCPLAGVFDPKILTSLFGMLTLFCDNFIVRLNLAFW